MGDVATQLQQWSGMNVSRVMNSDTDVFPPFSVGDF